MLCVQKRMQGENHPPQHMLCGTQAINFLIEKSSAGKNYSRGNSPEGHRENTAVRRCMPQKAVFNDQSTEPKFFIIKRRLYGKTQTQGNDHAL